MFSSGLCLDSDGSLHLFWHCVPLLVCAVKLWYHHQPHVDYCITVWGYGPDVHIDTIQYIQCRAARLASGVFDWNVRAIDIIRRLGAVLMYRCLKGDAPFNLSHHFTKVQHSCSTRQPLGDLCVPRPNIEHFRQCVFLYQGPILWNDLSNQLKYRSDILSFKRMYK